MSDPIPDAPTPGSPGDPTADTGFPVSVDPFVGSTTGGSLPCGLKLPTLALILKFLLPPIPFPKPFPPQFRFAIAFRCDLDNPLSISAGADLGFGGGRVGHIPSNPDDDYDQAA